MLEQLEIYEEQEESVDLDLSVSPPGLQTIMCQESKRSEGLIVTAHNLFRECLTEISPALANFCRVSGGTGYRFVSTLGNPRPGWRKNPRAGSARKKAFKSTTRRPMLPLRSSTGD